METDLTKLDKVERLFSIDGPHSDDDVRYAARAITHLVRYLDHATHAARADETLVFPSTVSVVTDQLGNATAGMVQLAVQLAQRLLVQGDDDRVYDDGMGKPLKAVRPERVASVRAAWGAQELTTAGQHLATAAGSLEAAFSQTDRLGFREQR